MSKRSTKNSAKTTTKAATKKRDATKKDGAATKAPATPKPPRAAKAHAGRDSRLPKSGSTLAVTWRKRVYEIGVGEHDFTYEKETFTSLSALAKKITGFGSVNGFLWAGLVKRPEPKARVDAKAATKGSGSKASAAVDGIDLSTPEGQRKAIEAAGIGKKKGRPISKPLGEKPASKPEVTSEQKGA